jgi:NadR type nicotinamide-nucleotide adenylyltransferase
MPPHAGHLFLCEFARRYSDEVTVLVCTLEREPIPGPLRFAWMQELLPWANVRHFDADVPQEPSEHPDFWSIWREIVLKAHPERIDHVFASDDYGLRLAEEVGATFLPVDPQRSAFPISGTRIRDKPFAEWNFLPPPVRAYYAKRICLFGPESSGKTTLAGQLAGHFATVVAPEYGRAYTDVFGVDCAADDLLNIANGQAAAIAAAARAANRILITDTDPVLTAVWAEMLLGQRLPGLDRVEPSDFYLLTDIDTPWADDGTRYFPDDATRRRFFDLCVRELEIRHLPFVRLSGNAETRFRTAIQAIAARYPELG